MAMGGDPVHGWLVLTLPPRQRAEGCLIDVAHAHTYPPLRYHHAELCPTRRMRTWWEPPRGFSTAGRGSRSHESGRRPGPFRGWLALTLPSRHSAQGCLLDVAHAATHPPRALPPRRALPAVAHAHVMGTPIGLFGHRARISLA